MPVGRIASGTPQRRHRGHGGHHGAVAAGDEDDVAALVDRLLAHADARVLDGGLQPERRLPAVLRT